MEHVRDLISKNIHNLAPKDGLQAGVLVSVGLLTGLLSAVLIDYRAWLAFGTGGTPANFKGYLRISKFRLLRAFSPDRLNDASNLPTDGPSYIKDTLRKRAGPAPKIVARTLPQRQYPEPLDPVIAKRLHALPSKYASEHSEVLKLDKSVTEGRSTDAIYAAKHIGAHGSRAYDKVLGDEIAHVHPAENSLHVWLTVADARKVVEAGWGERFPLSSLGMVNDGFIFLYAPRTMADVDVIEDIVRAGISHLTGKDIGSLYS